MPTISDSLDEGIRRRMVTIPFTATITNRNNKLKTELSTPENLTACLWWLVQGSKKKKKNGLGEVPAEAVAMAERYYADCDVFQQWLDERTEASTGDLNVTRAYKDFCDWLYSQKRYSRNSFTLAIRNHNIVMKRKNTGMVFENIALRSM